MKKQCKKVIVAEHVPKEKIIPKIYQNKLWKYTKNAEVSSISIAKFYYMLKWNSKSLFQS